MNTGSSPSPSPPSVDPTDATTAPTQRGISRRTLLLSAGATAVGGAVTWRLVVGGGGRPGESMTQGPLQAGMTGTTPTTVAGRSGAARTVLVVVQLAGGNDALGTLVPSSGRLHDARPTLATADGQLTAIAGVGGYSLAPAMASLAPRWEAGELAAVAGIGFEEQSRSHFSSLDTWWSANPGRVRTSGWLGRWLDATREDDPSNPLRAVALGGVAPALVGNETDVAVVLAPEQFGLREPHGANPGAYESTLTSLAAEAAGDDPLLGDARRSLRTTFEAVQSLAPALRSEGADGGADTGAADGGPGPLGTLLRTAVDVLALDEGTRIVHVIGGGFDTHTDQASRHPKLLADLADGVGALLDGAAAIGRRDDVLLLVVSEFGRRIAENGSGTDHGFGGLALMAGAPILGGAGGRVVGELDLASPVEGDLPVVVDARSVYAACLDHLGGPGAAGIDRSLTDEVLDGSFDRLGLVAPRPEDP